MISLIWTTYGAAGYRSLAEIVAGAKRSDPLRPVTVLVPTNLCGVVVRRHLARGVGGRAGVAGLSVLTVDRLAERLAAPALAGQGRRPVTAAVLAAAWRRALAADPGVFEPVARHPATVRALVSAHRELREVDEAGLAAVAHEGGPVAADLVRLHRTVTAGLADRFYDAVDLRRVAGDAVRSRPALGSEIGAVVLFLPQDLRDGAVALLRELAAGDLQVLAGICGEQRADAAVLRSVRQLTGNPGLTAPALAAVTADVVMHASDADDEVRCVVRKVMTSLRTTPAHRVAVLYGSARPYARLLAEHLAAAGLARNGAGVRPTIERTLARLLLDVLALPDRGWRRDEVLSVVARATVRTGDGGRLPAARWERLSREAGVVADDDWDARLRAYADKLRAEETPDASEAQRRYKEFQAATADDLRSFVAKLRQLVDLGATRTTWPELARWAADVFGLVAGDLEDGPRIPEEEARAAEKIQRTLAGMAGLSTLEETADVLALRGTLELELGDDLPRYGTFGRGVLVAPLSESIGLDVDDVFVVGVTEDQVPGRLDPDPLLPEDVRALAGGQLSPPRERVDRQHRHLLAALASANRAVVSFPRGDLRRSAVRLPSRWLLPTLRTRSGASTVDATGWDRLAGEFLVGSASYVAGLAAADELATDQEWRTRAVAAGAGRGLGVTAALPGDPVLVRAAELIHARRSDGLTRFDGDLSGHAVPAPTGDAPTSPTALEGWARCPHAYFVERLLGVRPIEAPEQIVMARPIDVGSIVHEALDRFHRAHGDLAPGQPWTAGQRADLHDIVRQVAAGYTARGLTGHPLLWERRLIGILADLDVLLDEDNRVRADTGRRQVRSELAFGMNGEPPVPVGVSGGRVVRFRGSADRVDRAGESIVVVDYKTGSPKTYMNLSEANPTGNGIRLQLPVYAYAARAALAAPDAPVSAEYWFVGRDPVRVTVPLTPAVEAVFTHSVDVIVSGIAAGLFPHRPPPDDGFGGHIPCRYCDPDGLGAGEHRQRWQRKRTDPRLAAYRAIVEPDTGASA